MRGRFIYVADATGRTVSMEREEYERRTSLGFGDSKTRSSRDAVAYDSWTLGVETRFERGNERRVVEYRRRNRIVVDILKSRVLN